MDEPLLREDWEALIEVLQGCIKKLETKKLPVAKLAILEFSSTASMLGLEDLYNVGLRFEDFLLHTIDPGWDGNAMATLSFAMSSLLEKMQTLDYGPEFSACLPEILSLKGPGVDEPLLREDWEALMEVLQGCIKKLETKTLAVAKLAVLEFSSTASMLGLEDLYNVGLRFEDFLLHTVDPGWDGEATATLSFAMGALLEKMQAMDYGPKFSACLPEILSFMDSYGEEAPPTPPPPPVVEPEPLQSETAEAPPLLDETDIGKLFAGDDAPLDETPAFLMDESEIDKLFAGEETPQEEAPPALMDESEIDKLFADDETPQEEAPPALMDESDIDKLFASDEPAAGMEEEPPSETSFEEEPSDSHMISMSAAEFASGEFVMDIADWYRELLKHDPTSRVFIHLAEELCEREEWSEAEAVCRVGLTFHPGELRGRVLLGQSLRGLERKEEALALLDEARKEIESVAVLYKILAETAKESGDNKKSTLYKSIFKSLSAGKSGSPGLLPPMRQPVRLPSRPKSRIVPEPEAESPSLVDFLEELHGRFGETFTASAGLIEIFSDDDRLALTGMLTQNMN